MPRTSTSISSNSTVNTAHSLLSARSSHDPFADEFAVNIPTHNTVSNKSNKFNKYKLNSTKSKVDSVPATQSILDTDDVEFISGSNAEYKQYLLQKHNIQSIDIDNINSLLYKVYNRLQSSTTTKDRRSGLHELIDLINTDLIYIQCIQYNSIQYIDTDLTVDDIGTVWCNIIQCVIDNVLLAENYNLKTIYIDNWLHLRTIIQWVPHDTNIPTLELIVDAIVSMICKGISKIDKNNQLGDICSDILRKVLSVDTYAQSIDTTIYSQLYTLYSDSLISDRVRLPSNTNTINVLSLIVQHNTTTKYSEFIVNKLFPFYTQYLTNTELIRSSNTKHLLSILNNCLQHHVMSVISQYRIFLHDTLQQLFDSYPTQINAKNEYIYYLYIACDASNRLPQHNRIDVLHDEQYMRNIGRILCVEWK